MLFICSIFFGVVFECSTKRLRRELPNLDLFYNIHRGLFILNPCIESILIESNDVPLIIKKNKKRVYLSAITFGRARFYSVINRCSFVYM